MNGFNVGAFIPALIFVVFWFLAWMKVFEKAGYNKRILLTIGMCLAGVNFIVFFVFAFSTWPRDKKELQKKEMSSEQI